MIGACVCALVLRVHSTLPVLTEEVRLCCFNSFLFHLSCGYLCCMCLLPVVLWIGLWSFIVAFPDHTHLFIRNFVE